jgi:hypothetical protein
MTTPAYYAGDRAPIAVAMTLSTGAVAPASVATVRVLVRLPDGTVRDWQHAPSSTTATTVTVLHPLEAAGADATRAGVCYFEAYFYDAGGGEALGKTTESSFTIGESRIAWPDPLP